MSDDAADIRVRAFIADHVDSVVQLEVLLLLHREPQRSWSPTGVAKVLRIDEAWVASQMADLQAHGLLKRQDGQPGQYQYAPAQPELHESVVLVARAYAERPVSVINLVYSKPIDKLRSFSEAFRFRKGDSDG